MTLYEQIYDVENLYRAAKRAMKGKKAKSAAAKFWFRQDQEIAKIHRELKEERYSFGDYTEFQITDNGVTRRISAAPFGDRVVHHAIMQVIEPLFEKSFIYDTYANRKGKGTLKALQRARLFASKYAYVLKLDIRKFFPSIDHAILYEALAKKIDCPKTLHLLKELIGNSNRQDDAFFYFRGDTLFEPYERKKGIPLGNLTSQFFGNLYLSRFDHFVKEHLRVKGYIRYVDDMLLFGDSRESLLKIKGQCETFLGHYRLKTHPDKSKVQETSTGILFLGHKVFKTHFRLTSKALRRGRSRLKKTKRLYRYGKIDAKEAKNKIFGTIGFFTMGSNAKIIDELLVQTVLKREKGLSAEAVPSRGFLEQ